VNTFFPPQPSRLENPTVKSPSPLSFNQPREPSRREFLQWSGKVAGGVALAAATVPHVHAGEDNTIRLALIGTGSRGSGAVADAFAAPTGPVKLTVMADLFEDRLNHAHKSLSRAFPDRVDVSPEHRFVGFDAYRKAIDCLRPGDVAMLTGYAGFRPTQLEYAVEKGVHVFMEKPFAVDPAEVQRVIRAGEAAEKKNLKIAAGLMCRHSANRQELIRRIRDGQLGQVELVRSYRTGGGGPLGRRPANQNELVWQIRRSGAFFWLSSGVFIEMNIHQVDELCWIKDAWPVSAHGVGGRVPGSRDCGQNHDSYSIEWTFPDGTKALHVSRYITGCHEQFDTFIHGTKCAAQFSGEVHAGTVHTYKDQRCQPDNIAWKAPPEAITPWQAEWRALLKAIRNDLPHNEARRAALANLASIMGRAAVHSGQVITWEQALSSRFQFCPGVESMTADSAPPIHDDADGRYPVPIPGVWREI
jgi:predicted dehydrogenase